MRILLASSEAHPYSKTGGLADMVGALGKALARAGHQVALVTPFYKGIAERFGEIKRSDLNFEVQLGPGQVLAELWIAEPKTGVALYFVDQPEFFHRPTLYHKDGVDYPDNAARFIFFSKAVAHLARRLPLKPELVHAHDGQTGLIPLLITHQESPKAGLKPRGRV